MKHACLAALALGASAAPATAQSPVVAPFVQTVSGTRLDVSATGEVSRVPDIAIISAGVMTRSASATGAISENAARMERVRAALKRAGIPDRDIQTANLSLNPEYRYQENMPPQLTGYTASNQVNGPSLTIDKPEAALDEARAKAVAAGRARAELYARALGMRVVRLLSVSEGGGYSNPPPIVMMRAERGASADNTKIDPGEQQLQVTVAMSFELQ